MEKYTGTCIYGKSFLNIKANDKDKDKKIETNAKTIFIYDDSK